MSLLNNKLQKVQLGMLADDVQQKFTDTATQLAQNSSQSIMVISAPYNAKGDGVTDDTTAIQNALNSAKNGTVLFTIPIPALTATYKITKQIVVPSGVSMACSDGVTILRAFNSSIGYSMFMLQGNNKVSGFSFNGGSDSISVNVGNNDQTLYCDLFLQGNNIQILNNTFDKSCGSSIVSGDNYNHKIIGNSFKNYLDHCIYLGGRVTNPNTDRIIIAYNDFNSSIATRHCIKTRNGVYNVLVQGNTFNVPNAPFMTHDCGDTSGDKTSYRLNVINNMGTCTNFFCSTNNTTDATLEDIIITNNNVICSSYILLFNGFPSDGTTQNGSAIKNLNVRDNIFKGSTVGIVFNGTLGTIGIDRVSFKNNKVIFSGTKLFTLIGDVRDIEIIGNTLETTTTTNSSDTTIITVNEYSALSYTFKASTSGRIIFMDNKLYGLWQSVIYENSTGKTATLIHWDLYITNNLIVCPTNAFAFARVSGDYQNAITNFLFCKDNQVISSNFVSSTWRPGYFYEPYLTTANRPIVNLYVGMSTYDVNLNKPIWLKSKSPVTWVDATGATV